MDQSPLTLAPDSLLRRSPLYRHHAEAGASFRQVDDCAVPYRFRSHQEDTDMARQLGLVDLCGLTKVGYKGPGASLWLGQEGLLLPAEPNLSVLQPDGMLVARLSLDEFLVLRNLESDSSLICDMESAWSLDSAAQTYLLPRRDSHCWLAVVGAEVRQMLSKICAINLHLDEFPNLKIAQTIIADLSVIIIRHDLGLTPCFYLLADVALTEYLWEVLQDAMDEFAGATVGLAALLTLKTLLAESSK